MTDKKGKPVQDLQKSDFIVYDNGQRKEITDFEKHILNRPPVKAEPQPAEEKIVPTTLPPADQIVPAITRKFFLSLTSPSTTNGASRSLKKPPCISSTRRSCRATKWDCCLIQC